MGFAFLTLGSAAHAGNVKILGALPDDVYSVSKDPKREWRVNDRICFRLLTHKGRDISYRAILACGQVLDVLEEDFLVHITSRNVKLTIGVTVSIGVLVWTGSPRDYGEAERDLELKFRDVDRNLYLAKAQGRNRVVIGEA